MTKQINVGGVLIGGGAPVTIQSMTNTPTQDVEATVAQIKKLAAAGCEIVRVAVPDMEAARAVGKIKEQSPIPVVVDIHFDYKLALEAIAAGADKVRINPGNIGGAYYVKQVADACRLHNIPIRIGVNSGSLEREVKARYGVTYRGMVESAIRQIRLLERYDFTDICVSLKASNVQTAVQAYWLMHLREEYPLHLGVTEAGTVRMGTLKSAVGIGGLEGPELVSCPTCGRTKIDLIALANEVEERLKPVDKPITVAVMGCAVNGPGEAAAADCGIAGGVGEGLLFQKGEIVKKVPQERLVDELFALIETL